MRLWILEARRLACLVLLFSLPPLATEPLAAEQPVSVAAGVGEVEPLAHGHGVEMAWELRFAPRRFTFLPRFVPELAPVLGSLATSKGALYAYGGFRLDVPIGEHWVFSPSWAGGLYLREGGQDLGGPFEFRTALELSYRLNADSRLGLCLHHLSNSGIFENNPGSESLLLLYSVDLAGRSRR
jgi:lipid A 3-O-deacylase